MRRVVSTIMILPLVLCACPSGDGYGPSPYTRDDQLSLSHVQAKGTHNSYHVEPERPINDSHRYTHAPLDQQLERHGVRQLELDLHYREGAGFEVFHIPEVDARTTCQRLVDCLAQVERWSDDNHWHLPILIWLEPKDDVDFLDPKLLPLTGRYDLLEQEILSVVPRASIFAPDDLRGSHEDLPAAITADGWPTLGELRGKVIFALLDSGNHREEYTAGATNLADKLLFVGASDPADPYAALFKVNNAQADAERVRKLVLAGFIVTSNVDGAEGSPADNAARLAASLAAGIHFGSSDYPASVPGTDYWFDLPGGTPARCNPVFPAEACTTADIENLP